MQKAFQSAIVQRFIKGKDFDNWFQQYKDNRKKGKIIHEPDARDIRLVSHVRETKSVRMTAEKVGVTPYRVYAALARVGAYDAKVK